MPYADPAVKRARERERYANDPEYRERKKAQGRQRGSTLPRRAELRAYVQAQMIDGCVRCGEDDLACLDWHHVDPATKTATIRYLIQSGGIKRLKAELEKCVVVCANCHRKIHAAEREAGLESL